jgi:hypothetical protein
VGSEISMISGDDAPQLMTAIEGSAYLNLDDMVGQIEGAAVDHVSVFGDVVECRAVGLG